jgi:hypothetical protein
MPRLENHRLNLFFTGISVFILRRWVRSVTSKPGLRQKRKIQITSMGKGLT